MSMVTARYFVNAADSKSVRVNSDTGWRSVGQGLGFVALGYVALLVGVGLGALLIYEAASGRPVFGRYDLDADELADLRLLGVIVLGCGVALGFGAVLLGQWLCLMYAPQGGGAKETIYVCFTCVLLGSALTAVGVYLDGSRVYAALGDGPGGWRQLDPHRAGLILLAAGVVLGLLGVLVFTQFLRGLAACFRDRTRVLGVDLNLWAVGLMLGGSAGATGIAYRLAPEVDLAPWVAGGWLVCFAWHVCVILSVRRCLRDNLRRHDLARASRPHIPAIGGVDVHSLSGFHRMAGGATEPSEGRPSSPPAGRPTGQKPARNISPRIIEASAKVEVEGGSRESAGKTGK